MTTATTPRQPAKRSKGRAQKMYANIGPDFITVHAFKRDALDEESEVMGNGNSEAESVGVEVAVINLAEYDRAVERMARALFAEDVGIKSWTHEKAMFEACADMHRQEAVVALKAIGIAAPRKERKQP